MYLDQALELGMESGYYQLFLDESKGKMPLLKRAVRDWSDSDGHFNSDRGAFAERIIQSLTNGQEEASSPPVPTLSTIQDDSLSKSGDQIEELTSREREILEMSSRGFSNQEIAGKLFLSVGTVKWHTSNVYGKLGVRGRAQAVAKANEKDMFLGERGGSD